MYTILFFRDLAFRNEDGGRACVISRVYDLQVARYLAIERTISSALAMRVEKELDCVRTMRLPAPTVVEVAATIPTSTKH